MAGWKGSFYPVGMRSKDFLRHYAGQFQTVEIDSTFYGTPAASTVNSWNERTPQDFIFAVKVPQVITHEKVLVDCEPEFDEFIERMHLLGDKLGPTPAFTFFGTPRVDRKVRNLFTHPIREYRSEQFSEGFEGSERRFVFLGAIIYFFLRD